MQIVLLGIPYNYVTEVMQDGYRMGEDRCIRPALVVVNTANMGTGSDLGGFGTGDDGGEVVRGES